MYLNAGGYINSKDAVKSRQVHGFYWKTSSEAGDVAVALKVRVVRPPRASEAKRQQNKYFKLKKKRFSAPRKF